MSKTHPPEVNLLDNQKFKEFIKTMTEISNTANALSLDQERKLSTQFFLSEAVYEPVQRIEKIEILGDDQHVIPLQIYIPDTSKALPVIIYFHRGGWVFGNNEESEPFCRKLANHLDCIIVAVEYRLAPEHPFPKPLQDCYDATQWISSHIRAYGGDPARLIVCGESAGGNLAAAVALIARDKQGPFLAGQLLIYPAILSTIKNASYNKSVDRYFLTKVKMKFFWNMYLQSLENYQNPYASLDRASDLSNLPPALIITAEYDPLRDEGEEYAHRLHHAGVTVGYACFPEVVHCFLDLSIYEEDQKINWIRKIKNLLKELNIL